MDMIRRLNQEDGYTILFVEHDMNIAASYSLKRKKIVSSAKMLSMPIWHSTEMSRVDLGGGTVPLEFANRGIDTIDGGVPVLGMHSPFAVVSKLDCFMAYKAYRAVFMG